MRGSVVENGSVGNEKSFDLTLKSGQIETL
jgi:hypothetical protein